MAQDRPFALVNVVFWTWREAMSRVAFGSVDALDAPDPVEREFLERWGSSQGDSDEDEDLRAHPLIKDLRFVRARVRWWKLRKQLSVKSTGCRLQPLRFWDRDRVRIAIRRSGGSATKALRCLLADVQHLRAAQKNRSERTKQAEAQILSWIISGRIVAYGRRGNCRTGDMSGTHERIPPEFFVSFDNTIRTVDRAGPRNIISEDWATCSLDFLDKSQFWYVWKGPDFGDVRFKRDEVLMCLNCAPSSDLSSSPLIPPELLRWYPGFLAQNPLSSERDVHIAAEKDLGQNYLRQIIRDLRKPPDGATRTRGRKRGKSEDEIRRGIRHSAGELAK
jgi:hypothetical protein